MNELSETEKAYLAGLIDGEGCIYMSKSASSFQMAGSRHCLGSDHHVPTMYPLPPHQRRQHRMLVDVATDDNQDQGGLAKERW